MTMTSRLVAGAAAFAVVLVGGAFILRPAGDVGVAGTPPPSPPLASPSASASSPAASSLARSDLEKDFTSVRYGYVVAYLPTWTVVPATKSWLPGTLNAWGSEYNDELKGSDIRFSGASQTLPAGQTVDQWLTTYGAGSDPATWPSVPIGGLTGRIDADGVPAAGGSIKPGGVMFDAVVISDGRAYNFNMDGAVDRATFEALLSTIRLPAIPALDTDFTSSMTGYSVRHPSAWVATPASKAWTSGYDASEPAISDVLGNRLFVGTSTKIPAGTSFDQWYAGYEAVRASGTCGAPASEEIVVVDGTEGRLDLHCPTFYLEVVVPKGGRAYVFTLYSPVSRPIFESILATIRLTPTSAKN